MRLPELLDRLVCMLYPPRCIFCDQVVLYDDLWCGGCPYTRLGVIDCILPHRFEEAVAVTQYNGDVRRAIWDIKGRADKRALRFFAEEMHRAVERYWPDVKMDLLVPVPSNPSRMKERGFNQAERLAGFLSRCNGIPIDTDVLIRYDDTEVQHTLSGPQRFINARKSYDIGAPAGAVGKTVLLVDDVVTTGSTIVACSNKLLDAGAKRVYVITATKADDGQPMASSYSE